jgi:iron complex outermembrane receptor protein
MEQEEFMRYPSMKLIGVILIVMAFIFVSYAPAAEPESSPGASRRKEAEKGEATSWRLDPITVYGTAAGSEAFITPSDVLSPSNQETYTKKSLETFGRQGNISVFKIVEMAPSVNYTAVDALGTNESGYHDSIRIRGKKQTGPGGIKTYDGVPISGNPGGGKTIFDLENVESVDLYKGYIPADKGLGFSNLAGKVDLNIRMPEHSFGADLAQTIGSDNLRRSFLRLDSGDIGPVSAFGSFSYTTSDKYKGEGDLERTNGALGIVFRPNDKIRGEFFLTYNKDDHHNYYNLTYAEARDLGRNFRKDFNTDRRSSNYYDYNRQNFEDTALLANMEGFLSPDSKISLKPYYFHDKGRYWFASGADVRKWDIDHDIYGVILKYEKHFSKELNAKLGYWGHRQEPPGPPVSQKKYTVGANGLTYAGWGLLAKNDYHDFHSPFAEASGQIGNFVYAVGLRYLDFKLGSLKSYTNGTNAATSQDYDTAIAQGKLDSWASVDARHFREWLPSLYVGYNISKDATVYFDYTRTYGLDVNLFPTYVQQRANFVSKRVTLQSLWDKLDLETADNFDLGLKYRIGNIFLNPNFFVSLVKNKQARVYDASYNVTYPFNTEDALGYGAEITASGSLSKAVEFLVGLSYNKYYFRDDIRTASNTTILSSGNQVPDAPVYMAKAALSYKLGGFVLTPSVRYMSTRYGDVLNDERIGASTIVDFDVLYRIEKFLGTKSAEFRLTATNLFNEKYISAINTADDALAATNTAATYQTGAPFGLYAGVCLKF